MLGLIRILATLVIAVDLLSSSPPLPTGQIPGSGGSLSYFRPGVAYFSGIGNPAQSLEWLVADSNQVIVAKLEDQSDTELTFRVKERIKGEWKEGELIKVQRTRDILPNLSGMDLLLFLQNNHNQQLDPHPLRLRHENNLILNGNTQAILMDFRKLSQMSEILKAARAAAAYPSDDFHRKMELRSYGSTFGPYGDMQVTVPLDSRLEKLGQRWTSDHSVDSRLLGIEALRPFKSQNNIGILTRLLADTRSKTSGNYGKWQMGFYHVRAAALDVLHGWNIYPPPLPDLGPILQYHPLEISKSTIAIGLVITTAWLLICLAGARFGMAHAIHVGFWRLLFITLCLALAVAGGWIWSRSYSQVDELMYSIGSSQHQVASYSGGVQYVVVREWTLPSITAIGHFDLSFNEDLWAVGTMNTSSTKNLLGFGVAQGLVVGPARVIHPFSLYRIPYWVAVAPLTLLLIRLILKLSRLFLRLRRGLCPHCGYDLRESPSGQCPECGAMQHRPNPASAASETPTRFELNA